MAELATDISTGGPVFPPVSVAVIARLFNLTERRIQQLAKQGILSKTAHGKYDLLTAVREYVAHLHNQQSAVATDPEQMTPKERLDWYKGTRERITLEQQRGELIPADEVEREWLRLVSTAKGRLMALPTRIAPDLVVHSEPREVETILKSAITEVLTELADG